MKHKVNLIKYNKYFSKPELVSLLLKFNLKLRNKKVKTTNVLGTFYLPTIDIKENIIDSETKIFEHIITVFLDNNSKEKDIQNFCNFLNDCEGIEYLHWEYTDSKNVGFMVSSNINDKTPKIQYGDSFKDYIFPDGYRVRFIVEYSKNIKSLKLQL
jgi:tRNA G10  N-methylase Trm11